jgi:hypothetical protein
VQMKTLPVADILKHIFFENETSFTVLLFSNLSINYQKLTSNRK